MADIQRHPWFWHPSGTPIGHIRHQRRTPAFHADAGIAFWFRPLSAVQLAGLLTELARQPALELLAATTLATALSAGVGAVRDLSDLASTEEPRLPEHRITVRRPGHSPAP